MAGLEIQQRGGLRSQIEAGRLTGASCDIRTRSSCNGGVVNLPPIDRLYINVDDEGCCAKFYRRQARRHSQQYKFSKHIASLPWQPPPALNSLQLSSLKLVVLYGTPVDAIRDARRRPARGAAIEHQT